MSVRVASRQLPDVRAGGVSEGRTHPRLRRSGGAVSRVVGGEARGRGSGVDFTEQVETLEWERFPRR